MPSMEWFLRGSSLGRVWLAGPRKSLVMLDTEGAEALSQTPSCWQNRVGLVSIIFLDLFYKF